MTKTTAEHVEVDSGSKSEIKTTKPTGKVFKAQTTKPPLEVMIKKALKALIKTEGDS